MELINKVIPYVGMPGRGVLAMITDHSRMLAREVIKRAGELYRSGAVEGDLDYCREVVIDARWPIRGRGGVARAYAQTQREVRAAIAEFYQPSEQQERNA